MVKFVLAEVVKDGEVLRKGKTLWFLDYMKNHLYLISDNIGIWMPRQSLRVLKEEEIKDQKEAEARCSELIDINHKGGPYANETRRSEGLHPE